MKSVDITLKLARKIIDDQFPEYTNLAITTFEKQGHDNRTYRLEMELDSDTWLRARGWTLWKATFELTQLEDKNSDEAAIQQKIIEEALE